MGFAKKHMMEQEEKGDWPSTELQGKKVCTHLFFDSYINKKINDCGEKGCCSYCGRKGVVRDMYDVGRDIMWKISLYYTDIDNADLQLASGVDGCCTIVHRIMLHENLGEAHRKHAYQLMANELKMSHPVVAGLYMALQLVVSLGFVWLCPVVAEAYGASLVVVHWGYLIVALAVLAAAYVVFVKKYYHLHEAYLAAIRQGQGASEKK